MKKTTIQFLSVPGAGLMLALWLTPAPLLSAADEYTLESARAAATNGNPKAECFLAYCYATGKNVPRDDAKALDYLRQAADQDYAPAENNLGVYYIQGRGVKPDSVEAVKWFRKAAEHGNPSAEYSLGLCYFQGTGVPTNTQECLTWYRKAAEANQTNALAALGDLYLEGASGVKLDYTEAFKWYQKGAALGDANCLNGLGFLYEQGFGTAQNADLAVKYLREAAGKGLVRAYANLGRMYQTGKGLKADPIEACKWYTLGVRRGDGVARHYLNEMNGYNILSESDRQEADRRIREYQISLREKAKEQTKSAETPKPD